jgi:hypothetical protein
MNKMLDRLEILLAGTDTAEAGLRGKYGAKTVSFSREVNGWWIREEGDGGGKEFTLPLKSDMKCWAGKSKARRKTERNRTRPHEHDFEGYK